MTDAAVSENSAAAARPAGLDLPGPALYLIFSVSGISALLYQLIWQRALLTIYGSNVESVTMVVSAFMVGLGIGSLAGGVVSKCQGIPLLPIFGVIEFSVGLYGVISLDLFRWVGAETAGAGTLSTGLLAFALILVPTLLMGSTLPLLVAHHVSVSKDVGRSVGVLYFVNTLGAGLGSLLAVFFVLGWLGLTGSAYFAAALNFLAGSCILYFWVRRKRSPVPQR